MDTLFFCGIEQKMIIKFKFSKENLTSMAFISLTSYKQISQTFNSAKLSTILTATVNISECFISRFRFTSSFLFFPRLWPPCLMNNPVPSSLSNNLQNTTTNNKYKKYNSIKIQAKPTFEWWQLLTGMFIVHKCERIVLNKWHCFQHFRPDRCTLQHILFIQTQSSKAKVCNFSPVQHLFRILAKFFRLVKKLLIIARL